MVTVINKQNLLAGIMMCFAYTSLLLTAYVVPEHLYVFKSLLQIFNYLFYAMVIGGWVLLNSVLLINFYKLIKGDYINLTPEDELVKLKKSTNALMNPTFATLMLIMTDVIYALLVYISLSNTLGFIMAGTILVGFWIRYVIAWKVSSKIEARSNG